MWGAAAPSTIADQTLLGLLRPYSAAPRCVAMPSASSQACIPIQPQLQCAPFDCNWWGLTLPQTILMIAPTSFFADYGNHIRIWQEAIALQNIGHRVVIATYHNGDDMPGLEIHRSWDVPWI